ncbi:hypothetical protein [Amycolatopsis sp. Poz14]|uniref:hypothetical protein n=1 Tax=Amycolatopsis sp. Poz14 TaxID=1447705 RepID=UPI001EE8F842|nr:hypothetical protein [Amycolatopsis sp. Poz14]MCG3757359.1 hypothetical protein [Amycolatopsis sp. Poz14]
MNARRLSRPLLVVLLVLVGVLAAVALFVHSAPTHEDAHPAPSEAALPASAQDDARPAWCSYPDSAGAAALMDEVDKHVETIARYSPGQPVDRFTLQLDLMTQCATDGDVAR